MITQNDQLLVPKSFIQECIVQEGLHKRQDLSEVMSMLFIEESTQRQNSSVTLHDLTLLPRTGVSGRNSGEWLEEAGYQLPSTHHQTRLQNDGSILISLGQDRFWCLNAKESLVHAVQQCDGTQSTYSIPCQHSHAWLVLKSKETDRVITEKLAHVCAVDCRPEKRDPQAVLQTQLAGISVILFPFQTESEFTWSILCDNSFSEYIWSVLSDVIC